MITTWRDILYALRRWRRAPGFPLASVLILATGLTASTAVFTYQSHFFRPIPGADGDGLLQVHLSLEEDPYRLLSYPDFLDLQASSLPQVQAVAGISTGFAASIRLSDLAEVGRAQAVTGGALDMLGIVPAAGRNLTRSDDAPGAEPAVMISHRYATLRYGEPREALDRTIILNGEPYTIVGVAPADFLGPTQSVRPDLWFPFAQYRRVYWARDDRETNRDAPAVSVYLRGTGSPGGLKDALASWARRMDEEVPLVTGARRLAVTPATWIVPTVREQELPTTRLWLAAAAGLLLLACANVANLILSTTTRRTHELALRRALGAGRGRIFRQLVTESTLLSLLAGAIAWGLAGPAGNRIGSYFARPSVWGMNLPREVEPDLGVLAFVVVLSALVGVGVGILPGLRNSDWDLAGTLRAGQGGAGRLPGKSVLTRLGASDILISGQVATATVLLVSAGLMVRTLSVATGTEAGFATEGAVATYVSTSSVGTPVDERHRFFEDLVAHFQDLPWVSSATVSENAPLSPHADVDVQVPGRTEPVPAQRSKVMAGFFEALGMEIDAGRTFEPGDTVGADAVAILSPAMALAAFGTVDAVGRQLVIPGSPDEEAVPVRVVGVTAEARVESLLGPSEAVVYLPLRQHYSAPGNAVVIRTRPGVSATAADIERELRAVDPRIAIVNIQPYPGRGGRDRLRGADERRAVLDRGGGGGGAGRGRDLRHRQPDRRPAAPGVGRSACLGGRRGRHRGTHHQAGGPCLRGGPGPGPIDLLLGDAPAGEPPVPGGAPGSVRVRGRSHAGGGGDPAGDGRAGPSSAAGGSGGVAPGVGRRASPARATASGRGQG